MLQLVVRSSNVKGCRQSSSVKGHQITNPDRLKFLPPPLRSKAKFFVQVSHSDPHFSGCCLRKTHDLVLTLSEAHFRASEQWDLFVDEGPTSLQRITAIQMILVPHHDSSHIIEACRSWSSWTFLGTCHASFLRMDMEDKMSDYLQGKNPPATLRRQMLHWHLDVYMDSLEIAGAHSTTELAGSDSRIAKQLQRGVLFDPRVDPTVNISNATRHNENRLFWGFAMDGTNVITKFEAAATKIEPLVSVDEQDEATENAYLYTSENWPELLKKDDDLEDDSSDDEQVWS